MTPSFKQLRYFVALGRYGHFGRAAEACSISQPALSLQVKELETILGVQLVERNGQGVALTPSGTEVLQRAKAILRQVDDLTEHTHAQRQQQLRRLRVGMIPTVAPYILPRVLSTLKQHDPQLELHIREAQTPKLVQDIKDGRLDCALVALPVSEPQLQEAPLFEEAFVLVRPQRDASQPAPTVAELARMNLLLLEEGHCFRDQALAFCKLPPTPGHEGLDASSFTTLVQMVGAGLGVTLLPEMAVRMESRHATVVITPLPAPQPTRTVGMVWRKGSPIEGRLWAVHGVLRSIF